MKADLFSSHPAWRARLAAALLVAVAAPATAQTVGFVAGLEGSVEIQAGGQASWAAAALDGEVSLGDALRTGRRSAVKVLLKDDTTLSIGEETEVVIDEYVVGNLATSQKSILRQLRGQMRTRVGEAFGGSTRLEIHAPTAVAGVKGTDFEVRVRDEALVCTHEGRVFARSSDPAIDGEVELDAGLCSRIREGRPPGDPEPFPPDFKTVGPGPSGGVPDSTRSASLFGEQGGSPLDDTGDRDWIVETGLPPVAEAPTDDLPLSGTDTEPAFEDPSDPVRALGGGDGFTPGAPEAPGPDIER